MSAIILLLLLLAASEKNEKKLPKRGTGLLTGRAGERRLGHPRTAAERLKRHHG